MTIRDNINARLILPILTVVLAFVMVLFPYAAMCAISNFAEDLQEKLNKD